MKKNNREIILHIYPAHISPNEPLSFCKLAILYLLMLVHIHEPVYIHVLAKHSSYSDDEKLTRENRRNLKAHLRKKGIKKELFYTDLWMEFL